MHTMANALDEAGYTTVNIGYPSRKETIETLAQRVIPKAVAQCTAPGLKKIHFVTHSMGGIILRYYLKHRSIETLGRTVMLSPPNQGSETVDKLKDNKLFRWINGPAGLQLGTGADSVPSRLGPVTFPLGIITGNKAALWDLWFAAAIPGEDDGKVGVESAGVEGMSDFLVVSYTHTFIMSTDIVIDQTLHFLQHGRFDRKPEK